MKLWIASMECAGLIEAGGVKNVTFSLCKEFSLLKHQVTLFIPVYKTNSWDDVYDFQERCIKSVQINHCGKNEIIDYSLGKNKNGDFNIVFIHHPAFEEKEAVYTYTEKEQLLNPENQKGKGHRDTLFLDSLFAKAVVEYANFIKKKDFPEIIHCQDASTALIPAFVKQSSLLNNVKTVVTIHNAGPAYHHNFSSIGEASWYTNLDEKLLSSSMNDYRVEPFLIAVNSGAHLTTVSEDYAKELQDPFFNKETEGLASIFFANDVHIEGITNGIDYERYAPINTEESLLPYKFNPETLDLEGKYKCRQYFLDLINNCEQNITDVTKYGKIILPENEEPVFIAYHGRVATQKGISVLIEALPVILNNFSNVRFIIMGQGETSLENEIIKIVSAYEGKIVFLNGYERIAARLTNAACDFIVLPSFFEPCGLEDFIAQIYGTLPIANKTGGLNKILDYETGFLYKNNSACSLIAKLSEVITIKKYNDKMIKDIIKTASLHVHHNYLWKNVIEKKYFTFFKEILKKV